MPLTAGQTTLATIRTTVRQRADLVSSQFVTDAELTGYINSSYQELYDLLVQKYGDNYFVQAAYTFVTDGTNTQFALPTDFFKLLGVDLQLATNSFVTVRPFNFADRNRYSMPQNLYGVPNLRYRLNGNSIMFTPLPSANQTIQLWYVPRLSILVNDTDVVDGVSGWEEYIVVDCVIKCLAKEESDVTVAAGQKAALIQRIEAAAENRDAGSPPTVSDTQGVDYWWPTGNGGGFF